MSRVRPFHPWVSLAGLLLAGNAAAHDPDEPPPVRYEISINGENFLLDANQAKLLESTNHPGTTYRVAVRVADYQHYRLNTLGFDYHVGFAVDDDRGAGARTATLRHKLGFALLVTDLGGPQQNLAKTMELLTATIEKGAKATGGRDLETSTVQRRKVGKVTIDGATLRYVDGSGVSRVSQFYLVTSEKFAATCILQCEQSDEDDALALFKPTLDSFGPK